MTEIRDPVHGYVKLEGLAQDLANTPQMQRLRWIRQLGLACLVYPGANHTRFEHSLGAYHLAMLLSEHLGLDDEERLKVVLQPCCMMSATGRSLMPLSLYLLLTCERSTRAS